MAGGVLSGPALHVALCLTSTDLLMEASKDSFEVLRGLGGFAVSASHPKARPNLSRASDVRPRRVLFHVKHLSWSIPGCFT
jgi:hypothetical protein